MHAGYALTAPFNVGALTLKAKSMRHLGSSVPWPSDRAVPMGYASTVTSAAGAVAIKVRRIHRLDPFAWWTLAMVFLAD